MIGPQHLAGIWAVIVIAGLGGVGRLHRWLFRKSMPRLPEVVCCRGLGPLQVTTISDREDELLVRLDNAAAQPSAIAFVLCLANSVNDGDLLAQWHRRRTLVWLQQDDTSEVVLFAGTKRIVVELWSQSRAA
jgi:hypothetical protein